MGNVLDMARQKTGDRSVTWCFDGPQVHEQRGELWGERVRVYAHHDKTRRAFIATVTLTEYANRGSYTLETFGYNARSILAQHVGRYSAGAFSQFVADVRAKCQELVEFGSEGSGGELLRKGAQLVNGTVTA